MPDPQPIGFVSRNTTGKDRRHEFRQGHPGNFRPPEWIPVYRHPPAPDAPLGTPITTEQAVIAVLRLIPSAMLGDVLADSGPGRTFERIYGDKGCYALLSQGEKRLADIAHSIWRPKEAEAAFDPGTAAVSVLGGLDPDTRRTVILVLAYLHLGRDVLLEIPEAHFIQLFEPVRA